MTSSLIVNNQSPNVQYPKHLNPSPLPSNQRWGTFKISSITNSWDNSWLILGTTLGYIIYDWKTKKKLHYNKDIGSISYATSYYKSRLIFFVGDLNNKEYNPKTLVIYDDFKRVPIGKITLNNQITNFNVTKHIIYLFTSTNEVLLFDFKTWTYMLTIPNWFYYSNPRTYRITNNNKFAFILEKTLSTVHIWEYSPLSDCKKYLVNKVQIKTSFNYIQAWNMSNDSQWIMAINNYGNKIHIYSTKSTVLVYCIYLGTQINSVNFMSFDYKNKFLMLLFNQSNKLILYKLSGNTQWLLCECHQHDDKELIERNWAVEEKSIFKVWFDNWADNFFKKRNQIHDEIELSKKLKWECLIFADFKYGTKTIIEVSDCKARKVLYEFNRKKEKKLKLLDDCCYYI